MKRKGFSLIEVMAAVVLVGVAVVALVAANSVFTQNNSTALDMSTAEFLTEQIRELTTLLPVTDPQGGTEFATPESWPNYDDVEDFNGASFGPPDGPINANKERLTTFASFRQFVTVEWVKASDFTQVATVTSPFVRVTVKIYHNGQQLSSESWIRAKY
jgi:prepilin-type N-terminal cleavage/methylation domain-containing protein